MLKSIDNVSTECFPDEGFDSEDFRALMHYCKQGLHHLALGLGIF